MNSEKVKCDCTCDTVKEMTCSVTYRCSPMDDGACECEKVAVQCCDNTGWCTEVEACDSTETVSNDCCSSVSCC